MIGFFKFGLIMVKSKSVLKTLLPDRTGPYFYINNLVLFRVLKCVLIMNRSEPVIEAFHQPGLVSVCT